MKDWSGPFTITIEKSDISDKQRTAAAEALGYAVDDEAIQAIIATHHGRHATLAETKLELEEREAEFNTAGGRGVELADEIDALRVFIAVSEAK